MRYLKLKRSAIYRRSKNQVAAKARKRLARSNEQITDFDGDFVADFKAVKVKPDCVLILRFPKAGEAKSISVHRFGESYFALGKTRKLSGLLKHLGIIIEGMTHV